jgi:hypothetical protein
MANTQPVETFLNQPNISPHLGDELDLSFQYRPFLNNNVILTLGGSLFFPGSGYHAIYSGNTELYQLFSGVTLTY